MKSTFRWIFCYNSTENEHKPLLKANVEGNNHILLLFLENDSPEEGYQLCMTISKDNSQK